MRWASSTTPPLSICSGSTSPPISSRRSATASSPSRPSRTASRRCCPRAGYADVAKAYILYRKQRENVRNMPNRRCSTTRTLVDSYLKVDGLARQGELHRHVLRRRPDPVQLAAPSPRTTGCREVYDEEIADAHRNADIHLHDLSMLTGYCAGWSLKQLIQEGLGGVPGKITSKPAKHLATPVQPDGQLPRHHAERMGGRPGVLQLRHLPGPVRQASTTCPTRRSSSASRALSTASTRRRAGAPRRRSPTSRSTGPCPADLRDQPAIVGGKEHGLHLRRLPSRDGHGQQGVHRDHDRGRRQRPRASSTPSPPIPSRSDFDWSETENNTPAVRDDQPNTARRTSPTTSTPTWSPPTCARMCCRLRLDLRELRKKSGGFFGSGESTGSVGVVTINMPRIAYLAADEADFYARLDHLMDHRRPLASRPSAPSSPSCSTRGSIPTPSATWARFDNHFSTIGLVGMNEAGLNAELVARRSDRIESAQEFTKDGAQPHARTSERLPGEIRRPLQPGGHARRVHHLPLRQA